MFPSQKWIVCELVIQTVIKTGMKCRYQELTSTEPI